jgi:hypothetical protein
MFIDWSKLMAMVPYGVISLISAFGLRFSVTASNSKSDSTSTGASNSKTSTGSG